MTSPDDRLYHPEDTWARAEDGDRVRVGISDYAQDQLGDIIWIELPPVGSQLVLGEPFGEIESTKTVADLLAPVTGAVVEVNARLDQEPELVNASPFEQGWMVVVDAAGPPGDGLLDAAAYEAHTGNR